MRIAVVILNWNGKELLKQFLPKVLTYSKEASIYVADNASEDNSVNYIKENFKNVTIIANTSNGGYAKGYNIALQSVKEEIYCLLNSDIEVTKNWLQPILKTFINEPNTAIIQPKILDYKNKSKFEYAGAGGGFIDKFGYPYCRGRMFDTLENDIKQYDDEIEIFWASGACLFIRNNIFHKLGGFDEDFFAHQEEIDLCWRAKNEGYNIKYNGYSTVYHIGGATLQSTSPFKTYLNFRNNLLMLVKNLPSKNLIYIIFLRLCLDGIAGIKFAFEFKLRHTFAIIKAHFSFYKRLLNFINKRKLTTYKSTSYYKKTSVIWEYYIIGHKKYKNTK